MELSLRSVMTTSDLQLLFFTDFYVTLEYFAKSSRLGTILLGVFAVIFQVDTFGRLPCLKETLKSLTSYLLTLHFTKLSIWFCLKLYIQLTRLKNSDSLTQI